MLIYYKNKQVLFSRLQTTFFLSSLPLGAREWERTGFCQWVHFGSWVRSVHTPPSTRVILLFLFLCRLFSSLCFFFLFLSILHSEFRIAMIKYERMKSHPPLSFPLPFSPSFSDSSPAPFRSPFSPSHRLLFYSLLSLVSSLGKIDLGFVIFLPQPLES